MSNLEKDLEEFNFFKKKTSLNQERNIPQENLFKNAIKDLFTESTITFSLIINFYFPICVLLFCLHIYNPSLATQNKCLEMLSLFGIKFFPIFLSLKLLYESMLAVFKPSIWTPIKNAIRYGTLIASSSWIFQQISTIFISVWNTYAG